MAYQAIYRKWRPLVFEDIVGQNHITKTLKNQIQTGRTSHAYLFCGTRGTGKTTAAKVFARAVNCENPKDGSPCNECAVCRGILDGSILDVSEIDAASNNGVDNIREIREDVNYVATQAKYRVYIIDEVHMLSQGAFNALLKTLEEPPEHVIFILATTEAHKVPETILSRCQRFDFKRIRPTDIVIRMKEIATGDKLNISEEAYEILAKFADGSMRDGLSILERCVSECGNRLTYDDVISVLGVTSSDILLKISEALISNNTECVLEYVNEIVDDGKDLNVFVDSLTEHFRDLMVCKVAKEPENLIDETAEDMRRLKKQAEIVSFAFISRAIDVLTKAKLDAKWVKNPRVIYELALIRLSQPELEMSLEAVVQRLEKIEEQIKNGSFKVEAIKQEKEPAKKNEKKKEPSARLYVPLDIESLTADSPIVKAARRWNKIAQGIAGKYPFIAGSVINRNITIDGEGIILIYKKSEVMLKKIAVTYIKSIEEEFQKCVGGEFVLKTAYEDDIEGHIVDFWSISAQKKQEVTTENSESSREDPLEELIEDFPEIIELTDESDFVGYEPKSFEQISFDNKEDE